MPNSNLVNAKNNMKSRIRTRVSGSNPRDLGRLAKSAKFVGLTDDAEVETDIDTEMAAAIPSASIDDLVEMSEGLKELRSSTGDLGSVASADNLTEGGNKFLKAANVQSALSVSGDLSYDSGVVSYTAPTSSALQVVATVGDLPAGASAGDQAVVQSNNKLYIKTADGWYAVALINTAPSISGNDASYALATDQTPTVITLIATDPENDPVTFSHSVTSGALNGTTVSQSDNVFTVTPHGLNSTNFDLTFSADDSVNVTTAVSSFTLSFAVDFSTLSASPTITILNPTLGGPAGQHGNSIGAANDKFGTSVAISGDILVVGAPYDSGPTPDYSGDAGSVYVINANTGVVLHHIQHTDNAGHHYGDQFGKSVAIDGDNILITAVLEDAGTGNWTNEGKVYLFSASSGNLVHTFDNPLSPYSGGGKTFGDYHSYSGAIAISGNRAVVGFPANDAAYVYDVTTGNLIKTITPPSGFSWSNDNFEFGFHVAIDGDFIAISGPDNAQFSSTGGIVSVWNLGTDDWVHDRVLYPYPNRHDGDMFGYNVALGGDKLFIGELVQSPSSPDHGGKVYAYDLSNNSLSMPSTLWTVRYQDLPGASTPSGNTPQFGRNVSTDGTYVVVATPLVNSSGSPVGISGQGLVYIFDAADGSLVKTLQNPSTNNSMFMGLFGQVADIDGDKVVVGAPFENYPSNTADASGTVYVWKA